MASSIINSDDGVISGTSGLKTTGGDDGVLNIQNNGTTAMTVDASGNVGVGTTPQTFFNVYNATNSVFHLDGDGTTIFRPNRFSTDTNGAQINFRKARGTRASPSAVNTGDTSGLLGFAVYAGTNYRNVAQIQATCSTYTSDTNVEGALIFATNGGSTSVSERARITSDGYLRMASGSGGIQFGGDTAAANALDDYEEGTFTPALKFGGNSAGMTYATNGQVGTYTKIGRLVSVTIWLQLTAKGSSSGNATITGLPFTTLNATNAYQAGTLSHWSGISTLAFVGIYVNPNDSSLSVAGGSPPTSTTTTLTNNNFIDSSYMIMSITYNTN